MHISYVFNYDAIRDAKSRTLALQYSCKEKSIGRPRSKCKQDVVVYIPYAIGIFIL